MEVVFDMSQVEDDFQEIAYDYVEGVLEQLRSSLVNSVPYERLEPYCVALSQSPFMHWTLQPIIFNQQQIYKLIRNGVTMWEQDGKMFFGPNAHFYVPGTKTPFSKVLRFLSYGDGNLRGIHQIQNIFSLYNEKINEGWQKYLEFRLSEEEDYE